MGLCWGGCRSAKHCVVSWVFLCKGPYAGNEGHEYLGSAGCGYARLNVWSVPTRCFAQWKALWRTEGRDELRRAWMRWENRAVFGWDEKNLGDMWEEMRWDEMNWDEMKCGAWSVEYEVWSMEWSVKYEYGVWKCEVLYVILGQSWKHKVSLGDGLQHGCAQVILLNETAQQVHTKHARTGLGGTGHMQVL